MAFFLIQFQSAVQDSISTEETSVWIVQQGPIRILPYTERPGVKTAQVLKNIFLVKCIIPVSIS